MDMYTIQPSRLPDRLREQALSHSLIAGCQVDKCRLSGRLRRQASSHNWIVGCQIDRRRLSGRHGSKLPRHRSSVAPKLCRYLCCDSGGSVTDVQDDPALSQASSHSVNRVYSVACVLHRLPRHSAPRPSGTTPQSPPPIPPPRATTPPPASSAGAGPWAASPIPLAPALR